MVCSSSDLKILLHLMRFLINSNKIVFYALWFGKKLLHFLLLINVVWNFNFIHRFLVFFIGRVFEIVFIVHVNLDFLGSLQVCWLFLKVPFEVLHSFLQIPWVFLFVISQVVFKCFLLVWFLFLLTLLMVLTL